MRLHSQPTFSTSHKTDSRSLKITFSGLIGMRGNSASVSGPLTTTRTRANFPPPKSTYSGIIIWKSSVTFSCCIIHPLVEKPVHVRPQMLFHDPLEVLCRCGLIEICLIEILHRTLKRVLV